MAIALLGSRFGHAQNGKSNQPSFPCSNAKTTVEKRICYSKYADLKKLDRELSRWYARAINKISNPTSLKKEQLAWLSERSECLTSKEAEPVNFVCNSALTKNDKEMCFRDFCLVEKYNDRIKYLYSLPTKNNLGNYLISESWPSGIRGNVNSMQKENQKICAIANQIFNTSSPMEEPFKNEQDVYNSTKKLQINWLPMEKENFIKISPTLDEILGSRYLEAIEANDVTKNLFISAENTIVVLPTKHSKYEAKVIRYEMQNAKIQNHYFVTNNEFTFFEHIQYAGDPVIINKAIYFLNKYDKWLVFDGNQLNRMPLPYPALALYTIWSGVSKTHPHQICDYVFSRETLK